MKKLLSLIILVSVASTMMVDAQRQHRTSNAPFLKPQEAVDKMELPDGFNISIFAAEPDIGEPIAFTFDERGRIWVVENYNYVNRRDHTDKQVTRIQILEDTNGDGVFDKKKTFTDKLTFSSGIAVGFGGVFLGSPPHFTFIPDANGDDIPDGPPQVLLDGWGIQDRHETLNSFIWGPDGWLYGCHGVFTSSLVGKPGDSNEDRQFIDGGVWRYHPTKKEFEVYARGMSNPWGFDFNDMGQGFATMCVIPHLFHIVQGGIYHKQSKPHLNPYVYDYITTIRDHKHLSAHGGARFYLADAFPEKYRDHLFMCNIHQHQVLTDVMIPKGSSFIGTHGEDFVTTNDLAWVGFSVEIGPEGGVYILDWHDTDVCGNAINFPNSGRIYRIMPDNAKPIQQPNVAALSDDELVVMQYHPNDWYVRMARLHLQMRAANGSLNKGKVIPALNKMLKSAATTGKKLRALWTLHVIGALDESRMLKLLNDKEEYIRAWTIQFLCEDKDASTKVVRRFARMAQNDPSPVVRLYLAAALQRMDYNERWDILENLAQHEVDKDDNNIPRMLWYALEPMVPSFPQKSLEVVTAGKLPRLQEFTARRLLSGNVASNNQRSVAGEGPVAWQKTVQRFAPGFKVHNIGEGGVVAHKVFRNKTALQTHPLNPNTPCALTKNIKVPQGKKTTLMMRVSHHPHGDWQLRVLAGKDILKDVLVGSRSVINEWMEVEVDLTKFAGTEIDLTLENRANDWRNEWGYWGAVELYSE